KIYPFTTPLDLLRFTPVNLLNRIRMGLVTLYLQRVKNWQRFERTTASKFMRKWMGKKNYEVVWEPLLKGKFTIYHDQIAMPWLWSKFATRVASRDRFLKEKLGYISGSWGLLIDAMERRINEMGGTTYTNATVKRILTERKRVVGLSIDKGDGLQEDHLFDLVIATIPSYTLPRLVDLPEEYVAKLQGVVYEGAIAVIWVLKHSLSPIYWLNISDPDIPFLLVLEQTNLVPSTEYGGKHIIYTANYVTSDDRRWSMEAADIVSEYIPHLKRINPYFDESWVETCHIHKEAAAQPIMKVNYLEQIPESKTPIQGLWLASMSQVYPEDRGTNYSMRLGIQVARQAVKDAP
ncbi:amine oxidase, partial [Dehalococcoidia bacterium]|nr:amine oxidase [Dehalococcoidia bacterium]